MIARRTGETSVLHGLEVQLLACGTVQTAQYPLQPVHVLVAVFSQYAVGQIGSQVVIPPGCRALLTVQAEHSFAFPPVHTEQ